LKRCQNGAKYPIVTVFIVVSFGCEAGIPIFSQALKAACWNFEYIFSEHAMLRIEE
jgi:hypothetical protein